MKLLSEYGKTIKHLSPTKYRRLCKLLKIHSSPNVDWKTAIIHIFSYVWDKDVRYLWADRYETVGNEVVYKETINCY